MKDLSERSRRALEKTIRDLDPAMALPPLFTAGEMLREEFSQQRVARNWLQGYAVLALVLSAIGVFSVTTSSTVQRRREMGVRLALGATRGSNLLEAVRGTALIAVVAVGSGLTISFLAGHLLSGFLIGLEGGLGPSLVASTTVLACTALIASLVASLRVLAFDPADVLRSE